MISIIGKIFKYSFLINLFGDINVTCIFYKLSQTCGIHTNSDSYLETKEVIFLHTNYRVGCRALVFGTA